MSDASQILARLESGDAAAAEQLLPLVYDELRRLAAARLAQEKPGQTLQATALVHEAYLRLVGPGGGGPVVGQSVSQNSSPTTDQPTPDPRRPTPAFNSRGHFFAAAAEAMRRILVDQARRKNALRRGGDWQRQDLDAIAVAAPEATTDLLALDEALTRLAEQQTALAGLVKLRFFAGLTMEEAAAVLGISPATAHRHWNYARAWLHQEIVGREPES